MTAKHQKYLIEVGNFARGFESLWYDHWQKRGVEQVFLEPCNINDDLSKIYPKGIPCFLIHKCTPKKEVAEILHFYFKIPKFILRIYGVHKIILMLLFPIINSLIVRKEIRKIAPKKNILAVLLHHCYGIINPFFHRVKTFFYIHSTLSKTWLFTRPYIKFSTKFILKNKRIIGCSKATYDDLQKIGISYKTADFVLNGIPIGKLEEQAKTPLPEKYQEMEYALMLTRLSVEKQVPKIIEAYQKSNIKTKLVIVGDGDQKQIIKEKIKALHLEKNVLLAGRDENVGRWYQNAKFFIIYSSFEGAPRTIPESLALGTPVIVGDQGGCREYVEGSVLEKYIVDTKNTNELIKAIKKMDDQPPFVPELLRKKHGIEKHIDALMKIIAH